VKCISIIDLCRAIKAADVQWRMHREAGNTDGLQLDLVDTALFEMKRNIDNLQVRTKTFFSKFDADENGQLDPEELYQAMLSSGVQFCRNDCMAVFAKIDTDNSGAVSLKELCRALQAVQNRVRNATSDDHKVPRSSPPRTAHHRDNVWGRLGPPPEELRAAHEEAYEAAHAHPQEQFGEQRSRAGSSASGSPAALEQLTPAQRAIEKKKAGGARGAVL
jgi:hypothetical protein